MNRFKELRKQKGITQIELAQTLGVKQTTVSKWEVDKATPDYSTLIKLAEFYGVSADYLLGIDGSGFTAEDMKEGVIFHKMPVYLTADEEYFVDIFRAIGEHGGSYAQQLFVEMGEVFFLNKSIEETEYLKSLSANKKGDN